MPRIVPARPWIACCVAAFLASMSVLLPLHAQSPAPLETGVDLDAIKRKLDLAKSSAPEAERAQIVELLEAAVNAAELSAGHRNKASQLVTALEALPTELERARTELARPVNLQQLNLELPEPNATIALNLDQVEQRARTAEKRRGDLQTQLSQLDNELTAQRGRPQVIAEVKSAARTRLDRIATDLASLPPESETAPLVGARRDLLRAQRARRVAELDELDKELLGYDLRFELLTAQRDQTARELAAAENSFQAWRKVATDKRKLEAQKTRRDAEVAEALVQGLPAPLAQLEPTNVDLGREFEALVNSEAGINRRLENTAALLKDRQSTLDLARERIEKVGLNDTMSQLLLQQKRSLPDAATTRERERSRRQGLTDVVSGQIEVDRMLAEVGELEQRLPELVSAAKASSGTDTSLEAIARQFLLERRELLGKLRQGYNRQSRLWGTVDFQELQLESKVTEFRAFIEKHVLWIRSRPPVQWSDVKEVPQAAAMLFGPQQWQLVVSDTAAAARRSALLWVPFALLLAAGFLLRRRALQTFELAATPVRRALTDRFRYTLLALLWTLLLSGVVASAPLFVGWQLSSYREAAPFTYALAEGLWYGGLVLGFGSFVWYLAHPKGLLDAHFRVLATSRALFRRRIGLFIAIATPLTIGVTMITALTETGGYVGLFRTFGRLFIMGLIIAFAALILPMMRSKGKMQRELQRRRAQFWMVRTNRFLFLLAGAFSIAASVLTLLGFDYSAGELLKRFAASLAVLTMFFVLYELSRRWLVVQQRRIALEEFRRKREAAEKEAAERESGELLADHESGALPQFEESEVGLAELSEQSRRLLSIVVFVGAAVSLWGIWSVVFPALNVLEDVSLWSHTVDIEGTATSVPVTLADLLTSLIMIAVTIVAARNVPGLLELVLLQNLPLEAGSRYATTTIVRYLIVGIGLILGISQLGVEWDGLQWLVASLGVGLGFGLQEIVANFISGLIILFEQPFRVGDIVTIGDTTGTVSKIRIRATTVVDTDYRELVVPNKDFITGQLVNWSLSDPITRVTVPVGVAYGSDTKLVQEILTRCLKEHPALLAEPSPNAFFLGFGDNSLDFKARGFTTQVSARFQIVSELHHAIDAACREAGVEIAFPQRDIHLDPEAALTVKMVDERQSRTNKEAQ